MGAPAYRCPDWMDDDTCESLKSTCGNGVCDSHELCDTCGFDCGCGGSQVCHSDGCYTPAGICQGGGNFPFVRPVNGQSILRLVPGDTGRIGIDVTGSQGIRLTSLVILALGQPGPGTHVIPGVNITIETPPFYLAPGETKEIIIRFDADIDAPEESYWIRYRLTDRRELRGGGLTGDIIVYVGDAQPTRVDDQVFFVRPEVISQDELQEYLRGLESRGIQYEVIKELPENKILVQWILSMSFETWDREYRLDP